MNTCQTVLSATNIFKPRPQAGLFYKLLTTEKTAFYLTLLNSCFATCSLSTTCKAAILLLVKPENWLLIWGVKQSV